MKCFSPIIVALVLGAAGRVAHADGDAEFKSGVEASKFGELPPPRLQPMLPARKTRIWGFVAAGVSAAALTIGSVLTFGAAAPAHDDRDAYNSRVRAGNGFLIGGGLLAATAVTLFALHREIRPAGASFAPDQPTGPGSFGVRLSKNF